MKKIYLVILIALLSIFLIGASKPSLDGRAIVAEPSELPTGLFAKSPGYLPGDIVVVTNPQTNISIEVMIFGSFDATEGIAIVLSPEAAKELYISKGSNVIVQVTKKSDAYSEKTILSKTLQNYVPEVSDEEYMEDEKAIEELLKQETIIEENSEVSEEIAISEDEILFVQDVETNEIIEPVEEELILEIPEEVIAEVVPEENLEEVEVVEPVEEEPVLETPEEVIAEVLPEENLEEVEIVEPVEEEPILETPEDFIVETLPEENLEEVEIEEEESVVEFVAEMERNIPAEEDLEENIVTEEEVALIPTEPKPPVYTIIPVVVEDEVEEVDEVLESDSLYEEPEVIFIEDDSEIDEIENVPEVRSIIPINEEDEVLVIIPQEVSGDVKTVSSLEAKKYYVQIATYGKVENVEKILEQYGNNYPIVVYQPAGRNDYQVMIGGLNKDEYGIVLQRFRKVGYKDAFLRSTF